MSVNVCVSIQNSVFIQSVLLSLSRKTEYL